MTPARGPFWRGGQAGPATAGSGPRRCAAPEAARRWSRPMGTRPRSMTRAVCASKRVALQIQTNLRSTTDRNIRCHATVVRDGKYVVQFFGLHAACIYLWTHSDSAHRCAADCTRATRLPLGPAHAARVSGRLHPPIGAAARLLAGSGHPARRPWRRLQVRPRLASPPARPPAGGQLAAGVPHPPPPRRTQPRRWPPQPPMLPPAAAVWPCAASTAATAQQRVPRRRPRAPVSRRGASRGQDPVDTRVCVAVPVLRCGQTDCGCKSSLLSHPASYLLLPSTSSPPPRFCATPTCVDHCDGGVGPLPAAAVGRVGASVSSL